MSEPGINTDQSRISPSRRADLSPRISLEAPSGRVHFARIRRMFLSWRSVPFVERTVDYTILEGHPTDRADVDLTID